MRLDFSFPPKPFDVVGLGLTAIDHLIILPRFPEEGTKNRISNFIRTGGGQMGSGTTAQARLGLKVRFLGKVGGDDLGRLSLELLEKEGIDISQVRTEPGAFTQVAYIIVDEARGERTIMWRRHPDLSFFPGDFTREAVTSGKILHLDAHEVPFSIKAAKWAKEEGIPILIDAERVKDQTYDLLPMADVIIADQRFSGLLCPGKDSHEFLVEVKKRFNPRFCAVTLGEEGSLAYFKEQFIHIPAYRMKVVDSTGAGDVYHAAFACGMLKNWPVGDIMRFSSAAAALKCGNYGGRSSPTLDEVKEFMGEDFPDQQTPP